MVSLIIVTSSVISLGQPLLLRLIIDDALPSGRTTLLALAVPGLNFSSPTTGALGVLQGLRIHAHRAHVSRRHHARGAFDPHSKPTYTPKYNAGSG